MDAVGVSREACSSLKKLFADRAEYLLMRAAAPLHPAVRALATGREYTQDLIDQQALAESYGTDKVARSASIPVLLVRVAADAS